jgi:hypothetical protein
MTQASQRVSLDIEAKRRVEIRRSPPNKSPEPTAE